MTRYFVGIGSNSNAARNCAAMVRAIRSMFHKVCISSVVQTPACGEDAPHYLNAVVSFESSFSLPELHTWCKKLENQLGRTRDQKGVCQADLDILQPGNVLEAFFQPLVVQLQSLLEGENCPFSLEVMFETVILELDEQTSVGDVPRYLHQTEFA